MATKRLLYWKETFQSYVLLSMFISVVANNQYQSVYPEIILFMASILFMWLFSWHFIMLQHTYLLHFLNTQEAWILDTSIFRNWRVLFFVIVVLFFVLVSFYRKRTASVRWHTCMTHVPTFWFYCSKYQY